MSSALAAFAKTQSASPVEEVAEDEAYASEGDGDAQGRTIAVSKPSTLVDVAKSQAVKKTVTLVDVAKEQQGAKPATTLLDVARRQEAQQREADSKQLAAIAAQVQAEAQDAVDRRSNEIQRALTTTSKQVQQEMQASRQSQVRQALQQATQEDAQAEYDQQDDGFEQEDPVVQRAVERVVQVTSEQQPASRPSETLSVDRHVLKQRQQRHGLTANNGSKSASKATTMKEKLSSFQFKLLSLTQQRVFLAMLVDDNQEQRGSQGVEEKKKKKKTCNMHAIEELAKDRALQQREKQKLLKIKPPRYAKLDDTRHCRFKPKIKNVGGASANRRDDDDDGDDDGASNQRSEDFIRRMEATERVRNEQIRRTRAEREYLAQIDKKECPACGNPQSYSELTQKRKKCPNCGVTYKSRLAWSEIADEFLSRMQTHLAARLSRERVDNQAEEQANNAPKPKLKKWRDVCDEFLGRVQLDMMQREMSKELILQELEAECTFAPVISDRARRLQLGDFDERLRRDLENRRIRQEQYRLLAAAIAKAEASTTSSKLQPRRAVARPRQPFEQRLQQDLQRRRERLARNENPKVSTRPGVTRSRGLY